MFEFTFCLNGIELDVHAASKSQAVQLVNAQVARHLQEPLSGPGLIQRIQLSFPRPFVEKDITAIVDIESRQNVPLDLAA